MPFLTVLRLSLHGSRSSKYLVSNVWACNIVKSTCGEFAVCLNTSKDGQTLCGKIWKQRPKYEKQVYYSKQFATHEIARHILTNHSEFDARPEGVKSYSSSHLKGKL